jgi:hypothetical protein
MDMAEFDNLHPMLKELYHEAVVNNVLFIQNIMINDIIKTNNIDKWYNANKKDILNLINLMKEYRKEEVKNNKSSFVLEPDQLSKLYSYDIKELVASLMADLEEERA